eukprot:CAMPEP_0167759152 /NCGR_PEP_ID=MMETSP0110_2-20121227/10862_1 /TAXON_ID=629695 /ORGANISM="Gymnochlora sp., Strain CCMP2014" /LENGTH=157 /DNA_ID=CAMNT_0007645501 /DNA_START=17 /DNA_END=490 /DNA_ORIENTATION=+
MSLASEFSAVATKEAKAGSWLLVTLDSKKKVEKVATGAGLKPLAEALDEKKVMWAAFNVHGVDVRANVESVRTKMVQINWIGNSVPPMKKMQALAGKPKIVKLFKGMALTLDITSKDDLTIKAISSGLLAAGGAHKPTYYSFGDGKHELEFYAPENK